MNEPYNASPEETIKMQTQWWRWVLVPFVALVSSIGAALLMLLFQWLSIKFMGGGSDGWFFQYLVPLMSAGAFGWAFIHFSAQTAPKGKFITAVVMATILLLYCLFMILVSWLSNGIPWGDAVKTTLWAVAAGFAGIATVIDIRDRN